MSEIGASSDPAGLFSSLNFETCNVGEEQEIVRAGGGRLTRVMTSELVDVLESCRPFRTLEEHAKTILKRQEAQGTNSSTTRPPLEQLAKEGFLVSWKDFQANADRGAESPPPPVTTLGMVTRDRTESLLRGASTYLENARAHGRNIRLVILDDTRDPESSRHTVERLASLRSKFSLPIFHGGRKESALFSQELVRRSGLPPERVAFGLDNPLGIDFAAGAARNLLLLETGGELVVSVDDDTECRIALPPGGGTARLRFRAGDSPMEEWYHAGREEALATGTYADLDFYALHEEFLGRDLWNCIRRAPGVDPDGLSERHWDGLSSGKGRIGLTFSGILGDAAGAATAPRLYLRGATRERLVQSEKFYRQALSTREVSRCVKQPTLPDRSYFMMYGAGLDNRELLPPFLPVLRNEDAIFWLAFQKCCHRRYLMQLPWMLVHSPRESRTASEAEIQGKPHCRFSDDILGVSLQALSIGPVKRDRGDRMKSLGTHLVELASLPIREFEDILRRLLWKRDSGDLQLLERLLQEYRHAPDYWAKDVARMMDGVREFLTREDYIIPKNLLEGGRTPEEARVLSQKLVLGYGQLLCDWPVLAEVARDLHAQGKSPVRPV